MRNHFPGVGKMVFRDDAQTRRSLGGVWNACAGRVDRLLAASTVRFRGLPLGKLGQRQADSLEEQGSIPCIPLV